MTNKKTTMSKEFSKWLENTPTYDKTLEEIKNMEPLDIENDPEFVADYMKGLITEDILQAMEEEEINKSQLAKRMKKSKQYISRILNETANFTFKSLAEIACALNHKVETRIFKKNKYLLISSAYIKQEKLDQFANTQRIEKSIDNDFNFNNGNYKKSNTKIREKKLNEKEKFTGAA